MRLRHAVRLEKDWASVPARKIRQKPKHNFSHGKLAGRQVPTHGQPRGSRI